MAYTATIDPRYYAQVVSYKNNFGSTAVTTIPTHASLSGVTNVNVATALLIPANANQPMEFPTIYVFPRATIALGTVMLLVDDGTTVHLVDQIVTAAQTISITVAGTRIQFVNFSTANPLVIQPGEVAYLASTVAQSALFDGVAIGGIY